MTPNQLQQMGAQALRQLARQAGLRGAAVLHPDALRAALATWLSGRPPEAEDAEEPTDAPTSQAPASAPEGAAVPAGLDALPPALQTETMARLLETQGKHAEAEAMRVGIRLRTPVPRAPEDAAAPPAPVVAAAASTASVPRAPSGDAAPPVVPAATVALHGNTAQLRVHWHFQPAPAGPHWPGLPEGTRWQIELWIWRARGGRVTKKIAVDAPEGDHGVERPVDAAFAAAALGRRDAGGGFHPVARTPLWRAEALVHHAATPEGSADSAAEEAEPPHLHPADP